MRKVALFALVVAAACVDKGPSQVVDQAYVTQNLLSAEPTPKQGVNADLGGKVVYLGADTDKATLKPGEKFVVTHYWKVVQPPGTEYRVFTHVNGASSKEWMNVDSTKMRQNHGPDKWKAGDIVKDEQTITLRSDWTSSFAAVYVGLYRKGATSEKDRLPIVSGPNDGHARVLAVRMPVDVGAPAKAAGYVIRRAEGAMVIDGKADEPSWAQAPRSPAFTSAEGGAQVGSPTQARLLWDDKNLYAFIEVTDPDVFSSYSKKDDSLWKEDVVELFIDANGDGRGYVELQVNPNNAQLDSWFKTTRQGGGDLAWSSDMVSAVVVNGSRDRRDDADQGWNVEIAIPLGAVKGNDPAMVLRLPPQPGDTWKMNVVRVEKAKDSGLSASAWAAITIQDFHATDRLLAFTFGDEKGIVPTKTEAAGAASAVGEPGKIEQTALPGVIPRIKLPPPQTLPLAPPAPK